MSARFKRPEPVSRSHPSGGTTSEDHRALVRSAWMKIVPSSDAWVRIAAMRLASVRFARLSQAPVRSAPSRRAPMRFVFGSHACVKVVPERNACVRLALVKSRAGKPRIRKNQAGKIRAIQKDSLTVVSEVPASNNGRGCLHVRTRNVAQEGLRLTHHQMDVATARGSVRV